MEEHAIERSSNSRRIPRILRDQIWQFVGAVISALAVLAAYHVFFLQREVKGLQVVILASTSLVEVEKSVAEEIQVLYKGQSVMDLSLFQVKVENSGNQAVREEDYAKPIRFVFPPQAEIVDAMILESSPQNIGMVVQAEQNTATLSPVLLNEGDRAVVRFLVSNMPFNGSPDQFTVDARIAGVKEIYTLNAIEEKKTERTDSTALAWVIGGVAGFGIGFLVAGFLGFMAQQLLLARDRRGGWSRVIFWTGIMVVGLGLFVWLTLRLFLIL
jgi:hypothetical protein